MQKKLDLSSYYQLNQPEKKTIESQSVLLLNMFMVGIFMYNRMFSAFKTSTKFIA